PLLLPLLPVQLVLPYSDIWVTVLVEKPHWLLHYSPWVFQPCVLAYFQPMHRLVLLPHYYLHFVVYDKGWVLAANGAVLFFLPLKMRLKANVPGMACSRNWVHPSALSWPQVHS